MHNNSSICTINPIIPRQQTKKKNFGFFYFLIFYDVMMTSSRHYSSPSPAEHGLVQEKKKFSFFGQNFGHFPTKNA